MQQLSLRVLQEDEIIPVGATKYRKVNVRVLAATHRNLVAMCEAGYFRWDLYYRLAVVELSLESLQQRGVREKKALLEFFLKKARKEFVKPNLNLGPDVLSVLLNYSFPGNIKRAGKPN